MTRIVIAGAAGRMGQALVRCSQQLPDITLAGATEAPGSPVIGADAGETAGGPALGIAITDNLEAVLGEADVVIDFTFHEAVPGNVRTAATLRRAAVVGTTALTADEAQAVTEAANLVPVVWAPNMSLGVNLAFAMVKRAAQVLGPDYAIEIDDVHHTRKKDAPSGTALHLGRKAAEGAGRVFEQVVVHDEEGRDDIHDPARIVIRSFRRGDVVGDHTVSFSHATETLSVTHQAWSRDAFAMGALRAAVWVCTRKPRLYDMQDVLGLAW